MREFEPIQIVVLLACLGVAVVIVSYWRHLAHILFQCLSVVIACGGLLLLILAGFAEDIEWVQPILVPMGFLDALPRATGRLFWAVFIFSGIPLMVLFRAACYRLMPWLEIFGYPPALRDAFLATGIQPARDPDAPIFPPQLVRPLGVGVLACTVVFAPLIALSVHGVTFATRALETLSDIGLVLLFIGLALLGGRSRVND